MATRKTDPRGIHVLHDVRGEVQDFLDGMARSLTAGDGAAVAAMYELPALIISEEGVIAIESTKQLVQLFRAAKEQHAAQGVVDTRADLIDLERIGTKLLIATVRWPQLDAKGVEIAADSSDYTLRRDDQGQLRIRGVLMRGMAPQPHR